MMEPAPLDDKILTGYALLIGILVLIVFALWRGSAQWRADHRGGRSYGKMLRRKARERRDEKEDEG